MAEAASLNTNSFPEQLKFRLDKTPEQSSAATPSVETKSHTYQYNSDDSDDDTLGRFIKGSKPLADNILRKRNIRFQTEINFEGIIPNRYGIKSEDYESTCQVTINHPKKYSWDTTNCDDINKDALFRACTNGNKIPMVKPSALDKPQFKDIYSILSSLQLATMTPFEVCAVFSLISPEDYTEENIATLLTALFSNFRETGTTAKTLKTALTHYTLGSLFQGSVNKFTDPSDFLCLMNQIEYDLGTISLQSNRDLYTPKYTEDWLTLQCPDYKYLNEHSTATNCLLAALHTTSVYSNTFPEERVDSIVTLLTITVALCFLSTSEEIPPLMDQANSCATARYREHEQDPLSRSQVVAIDKRVYDHVTSEIQNGKMSITEENTECVEAIACDMCDNNLVLINFKTRQVCIHKKFKSFFIVHFPDSGNDYCKNCFVHNFSTTKRKPGSKRDLSCDEKIKQLAARDPRQRRSETGKLIENLIALGQLDDKGFHNNGIENENRNGNPSTARTGEGEELGIIYEPCIIPCEENQTSTKNKNQKQKTKNN